MHINCIYWIGIRNITLVLILHFYILAVLACLLNLALSLFQLMQILSKSHNPVYYPQTGLAQNYLWRQTFKVPSRIKRTSRSSTPLLQYFSPSVLRTPTEETIFSRHYIQWQGYFASLIMVSSHQRASQGRTEFSEKNAYSTIIPAHPWHHLTETAD